MANATNIKQLSFQEAMDAINAHTGAGTWSESEREIMADTLVSVSGFAQSGLGQSAPIPMSLGSAALLIWGDCNFRRDFAELLAELDFPKVSWSEFPEGA